MPCIVVPGKDLRIIPQDLLHDILAIILGFTGIQLGGQSEWSAAAIKKHFELDTWGHGMHDAFRRLIRTTVGLSDEIESWVHHHFREVNDPEEPAYPNGKNYPSYDYRR